MNKIKDTDIREKQLISLISSIQIPAAVFRPELGSSNEIIDFIYIYINSFAEESNIITSAHVKDKKLLSLFPSHSGNGVLEGLKLTYKTGKIFETILDENDGNVGYSVAGDIKLNASKFGNYLVVNWTDNSVNLMHDKKMEELHTSNEALEQFAYIASHDLQEPLRMVTSFTQLLQRRYSDKLDADANEFINFAVDGSNRMKELIDNLLIFSRVASRAHKKMSLDLKIIIDNILIDFQNLIAEHKVKIIVNELPVIVSDKSLIILIFSNLISNAIKYNRSNEPQVVISADYTDSEWTFSVGDNGIGIEEKYFEKIFLIFQRLHGKRSYPGTGIGLAICKKSVEKLGGRIWVESQPGKGTTFYFTIPQGEAIDQ